MDNIYNANPEAFYEEEEYANGQYGQGYDNGDYYGQ